jgi:hypothetical protein
MRITDDLVSPKWIWFKGILFLLLGVLSASILVVRYADLLSIALLAITLWAFCRAYFFAFYVIEHYVDPTYRFDGLLDFLRYAMTGRKSR